MLERISILSIAVVFLLITTSAFAAGVIQLTQTGQTECYDSAGVEIACASTGQDGEIQAGVVWPEPRFTPGTGAESNCITDNLTGLMWSKNGDLINSEWYWYEAIDYGNKFTLCGYSDWRLPNVNELESLINVNVQDAAKWLMTQGFTNVRSNYWSSTASYSGWLYPWTVSMTDGFVNANSNSSLIMPVWPVRSGQAGGIISLPKTGQTGSYRTGDDGDLEMGAAWPNLRFTVGTGAEADCVTDNLTGLMWVKTPDSIQRYWQQALDYSNGLSVCGYSDWRLPNRKELLSLSSYNSVLINNLPFTNVQWNYYWSSTTDKSVNAKYALVVRVQFGGFSGGQFGQYSRVLGHNKGYYYGFQGDYVWPVRSGQVREAFDYYCDSDFDGYLSTTVSGTCTGNGCISVGCQIPPGDDCNDNDASVFPGASDANCNTIDENCSGTADEDYVTTSTTCGVGACANTGQLVCQNDSVADNCVPLPAEAEGPYGEPSCSDGVDNDCDGKLDTVDIECSGVNVALPSHTGQTKCYNSSGVEITCAGTGQDGDIRAGLAWPDPRFTKGSGIEADCITDNLTGLMWPRNGNLAYNPYPYSEGRLNWNEAIDYANDLTLCGYKDWRLPNINELESLFNADMPDIFSWLNNGLGFPFGEGFFNVEWYYYYSSTTCAGRIDCAWAVFMGAAYGNKSVDYIGKKEREGFGWPVRSGQSGIIQLPQTGQKTSYRIGDDGDLKMGVSWPEPRFFVNGYCVTDNLTGLMWLKNAGIATIFTDNAIEWSSAIELANSWSECGYSDWRLPNRRELRSLIDYSNYNPALPSGHPFINVKSGEYWSSTWYANNTYYWMRWIVDMGEGYVDFENTGYPINFWPVRSGAVGGSFDYFCDSDGDGYVDSSKDGSCTRSDCQPAECQITPGNDCNDSDQYLNPNASDDNCNGIDENCDKYADGGYRETLTICGTGECASTGVLICQNGSTLNTCTPINPTGNDDNCNDIDENCNGTADENYINIQTNCGVGECASTGQLICQNGITFDSCTAGQPQVEGPYGNPTCSDGLDNDCDGFTDVNDLDCNNQNNSLPDLVVISVGFIPAKVIRGSSMTVTDTIKNRGRGPAGDSATNYYLSKDNIKSKKDILLIDSSSVQVLDAAASSSITTAVIIPANTKPGKYYVIACADDTKKVKESKEKNNCRASKKPVKVSRE